MFNKSVWIYVIIFAMVLAPPIIGIVASGQADKSVDSEENLEYTEPIIKLYVASTGELLEMGLEEYVIGVMLAEAPCKYDSEVLKALAVAIRSRCVRRLQREEIHTGHFSADFCTDTNHCMGYISIADAGQRWGNDKVDAYFKTVEEAVTKTKGQILTYESEAAECVFHVSSYAQTENAEEIWGINVPYLCSVKTYEIPLCESRIFTENEAIQLLEGAGIRVSTENSPLGQKEDNENGRCAYLTLFGRRISGIRVREIFGLASTSFAVKYEDGVFLFETRGLGHGVGLSMEGAEVMAKNNKSYQDVLEAYYEGAELTGLFSDENTYG